MTSAEFLQAFETRGWIKKPQSLGRGLLAWLAIVVAMFALVFQRPNLVATGSEATWIGSLPFLAVFLGYLFYRQLNPLAAVLEIGRGFVGPASSGRAWAVGIAVTVVMLASVELVLPAGFLDRHQWVVWGPIVVGALFGNAAYAETNFLHAATLGLRRTVKLAAIIFACALILAVVVGGFLGLQAFLNSYGIIGLIVILLALIVLQLQRLIARR